METPHLKEASKGDQDDPGEVGWVGAEGEEEVSRKLQQVEER